MRPAVALLLALALAVTAAPAGAMAETAAEGEGGEPPGWLMVVVNALVRPLDRGMLALFPLIDTDPNRGPTVGLLPVLMLQDRGRRRVTEIHAPSLAYNGIFGVIGTYRLFLYPTPLSQFAARVSWASNVNRNANAEYRTRNLLDLGLSLLARVEWLRDGSLRFFGFGPGTDPADETNYTQDLVYYRLRTGLPIGLGGRLAVFLEQGVRFDRILEGPIDDLPDLVDVRPALARPEFERLTSYGLSVAYDARDNGIATTVGGLVEGGVLVYAPHPFRLDADFWHLFLDLRSFFRRSPASRWVFAGQIRFDQMVGDDIPFYVQPTLGGKFSLRSFGDRRFTDEGRVFANFEARFLAWDLVVRGVPLEAWLDPFVGAGTVFETPADIEFEELQWAVGGAVRIVARPQVVGSIDVGYGPEGVAVFMDIGYSF